MDKTFISLLVLFAIACVGLPAASKFLIRRKFAKLVTPFRPVYTKRESILCSGDLENYTTLTNLLEPVGMRLIPDAGVREIARVKTDVPAKESSQAFWDIDGRTIQFLLVEISKMAPLAVVHIGGDGTMAQMPDFMVPDTFCSELFESIGVPEIVVYARDMENPERVVSRIQEILKEGKTGVINV